MDNQILQKLDKEELYQKAKEESVVNRAFWIKISEIINLKQ